jgi:uncharacterized protein (DUF2336 family)
MATVSSFEGLQPPTRSELRQFAELFTPLFAASSDEAKRQAVAALSQCPEIPQAVALFIGCQPIGIAASFLISSPSINDDTLIAVARMQGIDHMRAIVSRDSLSPRVIDVLVGLRHAGPKRAADATAPEFVADAIPDEPAAPIAALSEASMVVEPTQSTITPAAPEVTEIPAAIAEVAMAAPTPVVIRPNDSIAARILAAAEIAPPVAKPLEVETVAPESIAVTAPVLPAPALPASPLPAPVLPAVAATTTSAEREDEMRNAIKGLTRHLGGDDTDRLGLRTLSTLQSALLVRFARSREALPFATALADALSASRWLSERIMLDMSGQQLATTLTSIGMDFSDAVFILEKLYPHLAEAQHSVTRAWMVLDALDPEECHARVESWRRADSYTYLPEQAPATQVQTAHARAIHQPPPRAMRLVGRSR